MLSLVCIKSLFEDVVMVITILFIFTACAEAAAACEAGMKASLVVREGNGPLSEDDLQRFNIVATFDELACDLDEEDFPSAKEARTEENGDDDDEDDDDEVDDDDGEVDGDEPEGASEEDA